MMRRMLALAIGALLLALAPATTAAAGQYSEPTIGFEDLGNGRYRIFGTGCQPIEPIEVTARPGDASASGTTDVEGAFSVELFIGTRPGRYRVTATCGDLQQQVTIDVRPTNGPPDDPPGRDPGDPPEETADVLGIDETEQSDPPDDGGQGTSSGVGGQGSSSGVPGALAFTGLDPLALLRIGAVLVALGVLGVHLAQRRRRARHASL